MLQSLEPRAWRRVESPPVEVIIHVTSPVSITRVFRHFARPIKKIVSHDQQVGLDRGASASNFVELPNCADFPQRMRTASETRNEFSSVFLGPFAAPFLVLYHGGRRAHFSGFQNFTVVRGLFNAAEARTAEAPDNIRAFKRSASSCVQILYLTGLIARSLKHIQSVLGQSVPNALHADAPIYDRGASGSA